MAADENLKGIHRNAEKRVEILRRPARLVETKAPVKEVKEQ